MAEPVLELVVRNHAGAMLHVTGLFARRAFNLEGILCGPLESGELSVMYLLVREDERLSQLVRQLERLHDVVSVELHRDRDVSVFYDLAPLCASPS